MGKPKIIPKAFITESYLIMDEKGVAQVRIEACGNVRGLDDIMEFIRNSEVEIKQDKR